MARQQVTAGISEVRSRSERRLSLLFYLLITYILLQFAWWAYLLIDLNRKYYASEGADAVRIKSLMVLGEGSVFLIFLLAGIFIMQRTIRKDIALVKQQRNFLLSITHELKTPIAAIKLCLQTLEKRTTLSGEQRLPLQRTALENTERLHNLIDNVLLATRIESGQQPVQPELLDVSKFTNDLCAGLLTTIAQDTPLKVQIAPGVHLKTDRIAYESILVNLVENAVKYAGEGAVEIKLSRTDETVLLEVADLGPGIPQAEKQQVFQKFYRMGNEETRTRKGTGLGLFIVHKLSQMLGAEVNLRDNEPKGSIFAVRFPAKS